MEEQLKSNAKRLQVLETLMLNYSQKYGENINKWSNKEIQDAVDRVKVVEKQWAIKNAEMA